MSGPADETDCPACGCNDWRVLGSESSAGRMFGGGWITRVVRTVVRRACNHCGHRYRSIDQQAVGEAVANARPRPDRSTRTK